MKPIHISAQMAQIADNTATHLLSPSARLQWDLPRMARTALSLHHGRRAAHVPTCMHLRSVKTLEPFEIAATMLSS